MYVCMHGCMHVCMYVYMCVDHLIFQPIPLSSPVFRPGDEGLFWYTVLSGSLEMLQGNDDSSKVR